MFQKTTLKNFNCKLLNTMIHFLCITIGVNPLNCLDYGYDTVYGATSNFITTTVFDCQSSCVLDPTCQKFTYNWKSSTCYLKSGTTGRRGNAGKKCIRDSDSLYICRKTQNEMRKNQAMPKLKYS